MAVPYTFAGATSALPLSQLDSNFATAITLGNTAMYLGNTTTSVGNVTLISSTVSNVTVTNYTETVYGIGNSSTSQSLSLANGTIQTVTMTGNCTFTLPTISAGKSFVLITTQDATGGRTGTFITSPSGYVKWPGAIPPTLTSAASGKDIITFICDGINWYGTYVQAFG